MSDDVAAYLESAGARPARGSEWVMTCPFCSKSGHLYVNAEEGEDLTGGVAPAGRWCCFRCGQASRRFDRLLAELEGITVDEARAMMGRWKLHGARMRAGSLREPAPPPPALAAQEPAPAAQGPDPDSGRECRADRAHLPPEFESVTRVWPRYLTTRGVSRDLAASLDLGVVRRHDRCPACRGRSCPNDMTRRVILPIDCPAGRSYTGRALDESDPLRYKSGPDAGTMLFGWQSLGWFDGPVVAVEGPFDALRVMGAELASVALLGKDLRDTQAKMLLELRRPVVFLLDAEADALESGARAVEAMLAAVARSVDVRAACLETGDPGEAAHDAIRAAVGSAMTASDALLRAREMVKM